MGRLQKPDDRRIRRLVEVPRAVEVERAVGAVDRAAGEVAVGLDRAHERQQGVVGPRLAAVRLPGVEVATHRPDDAEVVDR